MRRKRYDIDRNGKPKVEKADLFILLEFLVSVLLAIVAHFFLKQEITTGTVLMLGILITMSTYILKHQINDANNKQIQESRKYLERIQKWIDIEHHEDKEIRKLGLNILSRADVELDKILQKKWEINNSLDLDSTIKDCVKEAKQEILATHINAKEWKDAQACKLIFEENKKAIKRGVKIHRIFILMDNELRDPSVKAIIEEHKGAGVKVECVKGTDLTGDKVKDFLVFDKKKVIIENLSPDFREFTEGTVSKNENDIEQWTQTFKTISTRSSDDLSKFF